MVMMEWKERSVPDSLIFATPKNSFLLEDRVSVQAALYKEKVVFFSRDKEVLKNYKRVGCGESTLTSKATPLVTVESHHQ